MLVSLPDTVPLALLPIYQHGTFRIEPLRKPHDRPSLEPSETCCLLHQDDASCRVLRPEMR
jgi:hypothetical protein